MMIKPNLSSSLDTWLHYLENIHTKTIDMGLERVKTVATRMNLSLNNSIIVGGTNGKGSVCHMLESIYKAAGYRTGLYTSPHLVHYNERIHLDGAPCSEEKIVEALATIEQFRGDVSLTYFEYSTLAALYLFSQEQVDVAILEVGLGGRLDAVNIIDADCSIITSIALDHTDYLGDTREKIAWDKAHIYRAGKTAICADPEPPSTLIEYAEQIQADLWLFGRDFNYSGDKQQWAFAARGTHRSALPWPSLRGANQLINASAALAAIQALSHRLPVHNQAIKEGLLQLNLPGRFQILPGQPTIILDVAHNPHAVATLGHNLDHMSYHPYTHAVIGMLKDKDSLESIKCMGKRIDHWYCATLEGERGRAGDELAETIRALNPADKDGLPSVQSFNTPEEAFEKALQNAHQDDRIVVFGSFLTVAAILKKLGRI
ncbi:folylpolyglutamate synthase [Basilea psittacipulmonis DSM 24701]|uniref:Dihydrofolate synthase/folylpolyglutamate synthase n=2 Tax=Basilea TaxID=1472344 RepID=A0A077DCK8_9BURK|nr:folylpolyglutamate synthase [Basilea psittacipulmonis DSM 24701]